MTLLDLKKSDKKAYQLVIYLLVHSNCGFTHIDLQQRRLALMTDMTRNELRGVLTRLEKIGFTLDLTPDSFLLFDDLKALQGRAHPKVTPVKAKAVKKDGWKPIETPQEKMEWWYNGFIEKVVNVCPKIDSNLFLTFDEFSKLIVKFGVGYANPDDEGVKILKEYYMQFSNNTGYQKGKKSLYLTFSNWYNMGKRR